MVSREPSSASARPSDSVSFVKALYGGHCYYYSLTWLDLELFLSRQRFFSNLFLNIFFNLINICFFVWIISENYLVLLYVCVYDFYV